jgi:hypothetical protein
MIEGSKAMKSVVIGSAIAAIALFFWGFLFWGATTLPYQAMKPVPDLPALQVALKAALPETGVYLLPHPDQGSQEEMGKVMAAGAFGRIIFVREGVTMGGSTFLFGILHSFVAALFLALLLRAAAPSSYGAGVTLIVLAGLAGAVYSNLGKPIWYFHPWPVHVVDFVYDLTSYLVAGLVLAKFVKPGR